MSKDKVTLVAMMMTFTFLALGSFAFTLLLLLYYYPAYAQQKNNNNTNKLSVADGIASGDVTDHSAIIWSRATTQALMHVQYDTTLAVSPAEQTAKNIGDNERSARALATIAELQIQLDREAAKKTLDDTVDIVKDIRMSSKRSEALATIADLQWKLQALIP